MRHIPRLRRRVGWLLVILGALVLVRIPWFYLRSWWVGSHLTHQALSTVNSSRQHHHPQSLKWPSGVLSVLEISSLGVKAPVLQGTQMSVLNVAVGHLSSSVMPGMAGTSVLAAHNATWFHHINRLKPGALIKVVNRKETLTFRVMRAAVVHVGTPVVNSSNSSLVLEACYPLNALYLTPYRYLVWANLVRATKTARQNGALPPNTHYIAQGIPSAVQKQGLTLATNYMPMGTLTVKGHPSTNWRQSNGPLNAADATTTLFFAALHIARANNPQWWHQLAPTLPFSKAKLLVSNPVQQFLSRANESEIVHSNQVTETTLTVNVALNTPTGVHDYQIMVSNKVRNNRLTMTGFTLRPLRGN